MFLWVFYSGLSSLHLTIEKILFIHLLEGPQVPQDFLVKAVWLKSENAENAKIS